ncbi:MAG: DinB family protein [Gemmatimonadetes bacterium]|nr:DinB family protein [Gemmatimonadota bacterium]
MSVYGGKQLAASFRTVRANTVRVVEEIPEEKFDFVAAPGLRTVRALVAHVLWGPQMYEAFHGGAQAITTLKGFDFGAIMARAGRFEAQPRSKAEVVALLKADGERFAAWMETLSDAFLAQTYTDPTGANPKSRLESLLSPKEHEMHHRAQLMLILRLLGGVPHLTRDRQARAAAQAAATAPTA